MTPAPVPDTSDYDAHFLALAINLARGHMLAGEGGPFGAVVTRDGQILATGWNQVTSTNDPTAHAEIVALRGASQAGKHFSLQGCVLYTSCEPCPMCLAAAYWARVERIVFAANRQDAAAGGFDDEFLYRELTLPLEQRHLPMQQLMGAEGAAVFQDWEAKGDKVRY